MPPVGNDVVDLKDPQNLGKSRDDRFLGRVFTGEERDLILKADTPDGFLWALWAAKEAAFKVVSRAEPGIPSIPRLYPVIFDAKSVFEATNATAEPIRWLVGRANTPRGDLTLRIAMGEDYVHAVAVGTPSEFAGVFCSVEKIRDAADLSDDPSAIVRRRLLEEIARRLGCPVDNLSVRKDSAGRGAPSVFLRERPLTAGISLSHDGRFTGFVLDTDSLGRLS